MIQEERVKQMTKTAVYEDGEGKKYIRMTHFFRKDYIGWELVKSFIYGTLAFILLCVIWVSYEMNNLIDHLTKLDFFGLGTNILVKYIIFIIVYLLLTYNIYSVRYKNGRKHTKQFYNQLKKVSKLYEQEERGRTKEDWE